VEPREDLTGELRDLLAVIHSSASLLRRRGGGDEGTDKHLDRIHEHVRRASELLAKLDEG
jgi:hypothetical protein